MEQDKIWDYFQNEGIGSFDGSYNRLNFLVKKCKKGMKVLNIGIGSGLLEKIALSNKIDIHSLDPSENAIVRIQEHVGIEKAKVGYSQNIPFDDASFDIVIMSEVLEHLDNEILLATIHDVARILKDDGVFIGTVPFNENLDENMVVCPKCGDIFHRWGHVQSFDETSLTSLLSKKFTKISLNKKLFINLHTLNIKGKLFSIINYFAYIAKIKKSGLNLFFEAKK